MIQGIRRRFIRLAMTVLTLVIVTLAGVINLVNWLSVRAELRQTVDNLYDSSIVSLTAPKKAKTRRQQNALEEARYFFVSISDAGEITILDQSRLTDSTEKEIRLTVSSALASGRAEGTVDSYLYSLRAAKKNRTLGVFLNTETKMDGVRTLLAVSAAACAAGIALSWAAMMLLSSRAIQPMVQNAVMQKRFITDAGHELKTPLTVISADMDALALMTGSNEWIEDTKKQVSGMRSLVSRMIELSRMDEDDAGLQKAPVDYSALVREQAESFQGMAEFLGKTLRADIAEGLTARGDPEMLAKMVSQLIENAVHYAPEEDVISVSLIKKRGSLVLSTENRTETPLTQEALDHLFDRFYRPDDSRSRDSGGFGIGLSMVRAVAEKHGGSVRVEQTEDGVIRFVCAIPG